MRRGVVLLAGLLVCGLSAAGATLDGFLAKYSQGNIHMALGTNPVEIIKLFSAEPDSYEYYGSDQRLFAYVNPTASKGVSGLVFIWEDASVKSVRISASGTFTPEEFLRLLGYDPARLGAATRDNNWLGNVPYYALTYTLKNAIPNWKGERILDARILVLLNHLDDSVFMVIVD